MFPGSAKPRPLTTAVVAVAAAGTLTVVGCGTAASVDQPGAKVIVAHDNANGKTVSLRTGDSLRLILSSSYWNVAGSSAARVLRQDGATVLLARPSSCPDIAGLGCTPISTLFKALAPGKAVIKASRTSCGEALRCVGKRATRFTLTVVVTRSN